MIFPQVDENGRTPREELVSLVKSLRKICTAEGNTAMRLFSEINQKSLEKATGNNESVTNGIDDELDKEASHMISDKRVDATISINILKSYGGSWLVDEYYLLQNMTPYRLLYYCFAKLAFQSLPFRFSCAWCSIIT